MHQRASTRPDNVTVATSTLRTIECCNRESPGDVIMDLRATSRTSVRESGLSAAVRAELLDQASWRSVLEGYARATRLAVMMVDVTGKPLGPCLSPRRIWQLVTECASSADRCAFPCGFAGRATRVPNQPARACAAKGAGWEAGEPCRWRHLP